MFSLDTSQYCPAQTEAVQWQETSEELQKQKHKIGTGLEKVQRVPAACRPDPAASAQTSPGFLLSQISLSGTPCRR